MKLINTSIIHKLVLYSKNGSICKNFESKLYLCTSASSFIPSLNKRHKFMIRDADNNLVDPNEIASQLFHLSQSVASGKKDLNWFKSMAGYDVLSRNIMEEDFLVKLDFWTVNSILRSLLTVGISKESEIIRKLQFVIAMKSSKMDIKSYIKLLKTCLRFPEVDSKIKENCIKEIAKNFDSIHSFKDMLSLYSFHSLFPPNVLQILDENIAHLLLSQTNDHFINFETLCKLVILINKSGHRPIPLIRAIADTMLKENISDVPPEVIVGAFYSMINLNYYYAPLYEKFSDYLCTSDIFSKNNINTLLDILKLMRRSQYMHENTLDKLASLISIENMANLNNKFLIEFVMLISTLSYKKPSIKDKVNNYIINTIDMKDVDDPILWLNYVWSLSIYDALTIRHAKSVLNENFYKKVTKNAKGGRLYFVQKQILNIKADADTSLNSLMNFDTSFINDLKVSNKSSEEEKLSLNVLDALHNFLPGEKFSNSHIISDIGCNIDSEFIVNSELVPVPISDYQGSKCTLPIGFKKIALLTVGFKSYLLAQRNLNGESLLIIRLLKNQGYNVVVVNENAFYSNKTTVNRVKYLRNLILNVFKR